MTNKKEPTKLYLIPTPISEDSSNFLFNDDIDRIKGLKRFIVEDSKTARKHLKMLGLTTPIQEIEMHILDEHTKEKELQRLATMLWDGKDTGLMSEAGAPGVADPGSKLVILAHANGINVIPLVGPSSILLALMGSGLNGQFFTFQGYLPVEQHLREQRISELEHESSVRGMTQIFIEAPYRNIRIWQSLMKVCQPDTLLSVAIDLTAKDQYIKTAPISYWKESSWPDFQKKPAIFLILSRSKSSFKV